MRVLGHEPALLVGKERRCARDDGNLVKVGLPARDAHLHQVQREIHGRLDIDLVSRYHPMFTDATNQLVKGPHNIIE